MDEFELTYLPKRIPEGIKGAPSKKMLDIYLPAKAEHPSLRIRKQGDLLEIMKKELVDENDASHKKETAIILTEAEYADLEKLPGKRIEKTRYYFSESGITYEIDIFEGPLAGLVLVDIEFPSAVNKSQFTAPEWLLADVTQEEFVAGGMLCGKSYEDIQNDLLRFGYLQRLAL